MNRRLHLAFAAALAAAALAGCAAFNTLTCDVSSYGQWPAGRSPGTYAFERLPSQQAHEAEQQQLEDAARGALETAGFTAASDPAAADVTVQIGARITRYERSPWDDPFWIHGAYWYHPWHGPGWGLGATYSSPQYDREVALLLRDRKSGAPLYETRASSEGGYSSTPEILAAMFAAALKDFPTPALSPRRVTIPLGSR